MENITKALLIAGAILILILILSVVVVFFDDMGTYFTASHDATMLEQLVEFNNRFENYNGQTIRGNELVSLMNRIIDYNNYQSGIEGFEEVKIEINLLGHQNELNYNDESGSSKLITSSIVRNGTNDSTIKRISETSARLSASFGITDTKLQRLSSEINDIVNEQYSNQKEQYRKDRADILTEILGYKVDKNDNVNDIIDATYQYYQFTQFKKAMFKCTEILHNSENGRVNGMNFEVVLENGTIKFD